MNYPSENFRINTQWVELSINIPMATYLHKVKFAPRTYAHRVSQKQGKA